MPRTQISCPNCRQPIMADINQLFDVGIDPSAKQRILSGAFNIVQCPHCGYQGNVATPIVYHDPDKELLLTYFPPEAGLPRNEQERVIGSILNQIMANLPQEKRKGYLLRPQETLTLQGLIERVLEAEGITKEMIEGQQKRINLVQRLMNASDDVLEEIAKQEDRIIDQEFFGLLRRLIDTAMMSGDRQSAEQLVELQKKLMPVTTYGRELQAQTQEIEAAVADLRAAGKGLTRERLLDLIIEAPTEARVGALVGLARPAMDYEFFQLFSEKIEQAGEEEKERLLELREQLLDMTREIDQQVEARSQESAQMVEEIANADDVSEAMMQNLPIVDEFFLQALNQAMENARKQGDLEKLDQYRKMIDILQQASAAPPEISLIEELLEAEDDDTRRAIMQEHSEAITPEFIETLTNILAQVQGGTDPELTKRVQALHRMALRFSMQRNLQK